jgi:tRNA nucleotidyltransferase (CCA-adding enzyme)
LKIAITHHNPDFDAISSSYAAYRLYDCDFVYLCHNVDSVILDCLDDLGLRDSFKVVMESEIDDINENIELLVITDCKFKSRLGYLEKLIKKAQKVYIYDHHTGNECDIDNDKLILKEVGASTSIIVNEISQNNLVLQQNELTLLMLGIYEDTGFLTFNSTTPMDIMALHYLLSNGGELSKVRQYIKRDLSKEQLIILNELIINMSLYILNGIAIGLSFASFDEYVPEISVLANKIMDMENLDTFFMMVRLGDRILLVCRSRLDYIDTSELAYSFGGGGHPGASSAIIKDMTLNEAYEKLKVLVKDIIKPQKLAKHIMTTPVKFVSFSQTFNDALDLFMKYNLNMMPVVKNGKAVGLISRKDILQGIKHGLSDEPVSNIMQIEFETVSPEENINVVEDIMLLKNQKLIPVVENEKLVGVITRTDLLRLMKEDTTRIPGYLKSRADSLMLSKKINVRNLLKDRLPEEYFNLLFEIGEYAEELGTNVYVVGGFVRDLLMKNDNFDVDIVVEGSASEFAKKYADIKNAKIAIHKKFDTAQVILKNGVRLDFATARTEYYTFPAAAPEVESSSIKNDLYRRDFTINAMAVKLNRSEFGLLLDFFGGRRDIKDRKIRVLHNLSFVDDPSRGFRAIRFAVRFDFEIGPHTKKLLKHAVNMNLFDKIIGKRLFLEIKYILSEENYLEALETMKDYDILKFLHKGITLSERKYEMYENLEKIYSWYNVQVGKSLDIYISRFYILFSDLKYKDLKDVGKKFDFNHLEKRLFIGNSVKAENIAIKVKRNTKIRASEVTKMFKEMNDESILFIGAILGSEFEYIIKNYFNIYRNIKLNITGDDLIKLGYKPSKKFSEILNTLLDMKIDGEIFSREEELNKARELFENKRGEDDDN